MALKYRFYLLVVAIMSSSYIYRIKKSIIIKRLPSFVSVKRDLDAFFFDFDFNDMSLILNSEIGQIKFRLANVITPSNNPDASQCEKDLFKIAQARIFEIMSKSKNLAIQESETKDGILYGRIMVDKNDLDDILEREYLAYPKTEKGGNARMTWCQMLELSKHNLK